MYSWEFLVGCVALFLEMKCGILYQELITYIEYFLLETTAYI